MHIDLKNVCAKHTIITKSMQGILYRIKDVCRVIFNQKRKRLFLEFFKVNEIGKFRKQNCIKHQERKHERKRRHTKKGEC